MTGKKNNGQRLRHSMVWMMVAVWIVAFPLYVCASNAKILSTVVSDGNIYVYIRGISSFQPDCTVQIGNQVCQKEQLSSASMSGSDLFMRTLVLIDNSKSIPEGNHADIQEILEGMITAAPENEQFKIGTFSDQLTYLCDYTNEKETLLAVAKGLIYNDQETYLSDILYSEISALKEENTNAYTRLVVFADGADDNAIGFPNDEVRSYIGENAYPVYTVGIPTSHNESKLEVMFSFSRAANAEYYLLDGSIRNKEIADGLSMDQNGLCLRISPDESLKDGSAKKLLLKLGGAEGGVELTTNVNMPFGNGITETIGTEDTDEKPEEEIRELPILTPGNGVLEEDGTEKKEVFLPLLLFICLVVVAVMTVAVLIIVAKRKKKLATTGQNTTATSDSEKVTVVSDKTTIGSGDTVIGGDDARGLWSDPADSYLILRDLDRTDIMWKIPIVEKVRIGRQDTQDIVIENDRKVSREHCEILLRGSLLYLLDCNSSNGTFYEGVRIYGETPIVNGGTIGIGSHRYQVEMVQE